MDDLLSTNGLDTIFKNSTNNYVKNRLRNNSRQNINRRSNKPFPVRRQDNKKPILSKTVNDISKNRYAKYKNKYLLVDSKYKKTDSKYFLFDNARYIINLNTTFDKIQKIKLEDFNIYNLKSSPVFSPYILMRLIPIQTNKDFIKSDLIVANSNPDETKIITDGTNELNYSISDVFNNCFAIIKIFKPTNEYIIPEFNSSEIIYQNMPLINFNKLLIEFYDSDGDLYKDMPSNFFTLKITEREDVLKNTNIDSRHGEVNMTGSVSTNHLLFN